MRNFGSGGAVLIVQNGRMLLGMVAVGSLWFVEEDRVGQTKPVRGETRNLWSELSVVLRRIKGEGPDSAVGTGTRGSRVARQHKHAEASAAPAASSKSRFHSSTASHNSFSRVHLYNRSQPESCGSCLRGRQARRNLTEDLLVVSGCRPLHMNTSTLHACFLHQPLELTLNKDFQLPRGQDGNGNSRGLASVGFNPQAIWGFEL